MYTTNITPNWMSKTNLGGYKFTLYLVKKDLWNNPDPLVNDSGPIRAGNAIIIAETGATTVFNMDQLNITTFINSGQKNVDSRTGVIQFQLQEVLGFNFLDKVLGVASVFGFPTLASASYVLKVEFIGRNPITDNREQYPNIFLYSLTFQEIQASVSESGTIYDIIALNMQRDAKYQSSIYTNITATGFTTVSEFISSVQRACNEYEEQLSKTEQGNPQPRKHWKIELSEKLSSLTETFDIVERADADTLSQIDPGLRAYATKRTPLTVDLANSPMQGTGDTGTATKMTQNEDGTRDITINTNTNISDWLEHTLTRNSPLFAEFSKKQKETVGSVPIIRASTEVRYLDRIDPNTNTPEVEVIITVDLYEDTGQPSQDPNRQEALITKKEEQQAYTQRISEQVVKKYNWLYTGQNTEVMGFDLSVNNAFFIAQDPNLGQNYPEASRMKVPSQPPRSTTISKSQQAFLSQIEVDKIPIERVQYMTEASGSKAQNTNEEIGNNTDTMHDRNMARREEDFLNMTLDTKGDPWWLGSGTTISGTQVALADLQNSTVYLAFLTYKPEETVTYTEGQRRGDMDTAASGLYQVFKVDHKFGSGQFTQTLHCIRNRNFSTYLMQNELENM